MNFSTVENRLLIPLVGENFTGALTNESTAQEILFSETMQFIELEKLENKHGSNWSYVNFPFYISEKVEKLWIYKV